MQGPFWGLTLLTAAITWIHLPVDSSCFFLPHIIDTLHQGLWMLMVCLSMFSLPTFPLLALDL